MYLTGEDIRILVTGTNGFIASSLVKSLILNRDHQIIGLSRHSNLSYDKNNLLYQEVNCDLTDENQTRKILEDFKPDIIFHLAGTASVNCGPNTLIQNNIIGTQNLLNSVTNKPVFVFASSILVYGECRDIFDESSPTHPSSVYGVTKLTCENLINVYHRQNKIIGRIVRLGATIGIGCTHGLIPDLVKKILSEGDDLNLLSNSCKPFTHIEDVIKLFELLAFNKDNKQYLCFNGCVNDNITVDKIARIALDIFDINKTIVFNEKANWVGDNKELLVDNYRARFGLNWKLKYGSSVETVKDVLYKIKGGLTAMKGNP